MAKETTKTATAKPKAKKVAFQTRVITHVGRRGRPAHPQGHTELRLAITDAKGKPLGEVAFLATENGEVKLVAKSNGTSRHLTFVPEPVAKKTGSKVTA